MKHDQKEIEKTPTTVLPPLSLADPITKKSPPSVVRGRSAGNIAVGSSVGKDLRAQNLNFRQRLHLTALPPKYDGEFCF